MPVFLTRAALLAFASFACSTPALTATPAVELYRAQLERAEAEHRLRLADCREQPRAQRKLCEAQARADHTRARASARADFKNTPRARMEADIKVAEAEHEVARVACGNADDMCRAQARAELLRDLEEAKRLLEEGGYDGAALQGTRALGTHECAEVLDIEQRYRCIREAEQAGRM
jgi:hypothetical protein